MKYYLINYDLILLENLTKNWLINYSIVKELTFEDLSSNPKKKPFLVNLNSK